MNTITVYNLGNLPTAPLDDFNELQEDFKTSDASKLAKLQMLIITRGFKYGFKAWKDEDGKLWIIDAHQRRKALIALRQAGFTIPDIPYEPIFAKNKTEAVEEIAAYNSEFAEKNPDTILFKKYSINADTLSRFELPLDLAPMPATDMKQHDLRSSLSSIDEPSLSDEYDEDQETSDQVDHPLVSRKGDLWLLGNHRLVCGDCGKADIVKLLMNGEQADLCITDPPYNVAYTGATADQLTIQNDSMGGDDFLVFLRQVFSSICEHMKPGSPIYVFHADSEGEIFRRSFREAGFKLAQCLAWVKNTIVMGRQDFQWQHEPILYGWKPGAAHKWYSDRRQSTVWNFDKPQRNGIHPTMKPIALICYPIQLSSQRGDVVVDFFGGSGTTMIACEKTDRQCRSIELDPKYVDASVRRYHSLYPDVAIRLVRDGKEISYAESGLAE